MRNLLLIPSLLMLLTTGREQPLDAQEPAKRTAESRNIPKPNRAMDFKEIGGKNLRLHLFEPSDTATSPRAAIVFFFGGGWSGGTPEQFSPQARYLADRGMLALCAEYRVYTRDKAMVVDCVADAQDAMLYVRKHAEEWKVDPKRIAAAGGSAGGHLAASLALLPYRGTAPAVSDGFRPSALVLFNPALVLAPVDGTDLGKSDGARVQQLVDRMGDEPEALSPFHHLSKQLPPTLILHGKADKTVTYASVEAFEKRAKAIGCDCRLVGYPDQEHGFFNFGRKSGQYEATRDEMGRFLAQIGFCK